MYCRNFCGRPLGLCCGLTRGIKAGEGGHVVACNGGGAAAADDAKAELPARGKHRTRAALGGDVPRQDYWGHCGQTVGRGGGVGGQLGRRVSPAGGWWAPAAFGGGVLPTRGHQRVMRCIAEVGAGAASVHALKQRSAQPRRDSIRGDVLIGKRLTWCPWQLDGQRWLSPGKQIDIPGRHPPVNIRRVCA